MTFICDIDLRPKDKWTKSYDPYLYALPDDGHPTTYFNQLVSKEIKKQILSTDSAKDLFSYHGRIEKYKHAILNTNHWLESVKEEALINNQDLEEVIEKNAEYMVYKEHENDY